MLYFRGMKEFELVGKDGITVRATTRAGLVTASAQGLMAAAGSRVSDNLDEPKLERTFSVSAADFNALLVQLLTLAAKSSVDNKEAYEDVRFTLITDKKAEGALVGRPAKGFRTPVATVTLTADVAKNEGGEWETTIAVRH